MKKSTLGLVILELLLVGVVVGHNVFGIGLPKDVESVVMRELDSNQVPSSNYTLKYEMPKNYQEADDLYGEISIGEAEGNAMFTAEQINVSDTSVDEFFKAQESLFESSANLEVISEDNQQLEDKTITKKVYQVTNDLLDLYAFVATIDFKSNPDEFIGVIGNSISLDYEKDFDTLINSIQYTSQPIDAPRTFATESEPIKITVPANWKKFQKQVPYSFYKEDENGIAYAVITSGDKSQEDAKQGYDTAKASFIETEGANVIEDSKVENIDGKTITTTIVEYPENYSTSYIVLVEYDNSDVFTAIRYEILSQDGKADYIKEELDSITKSLKLK